MQLHGEALVTQGKAAEEIIRTAQEKNVDMINVDMIIIGSHSSLPLGKMLLGSTAERVLHKAPCPVLMVPLR